MNRALRSDVTTRAEGADLSDEVSLLVHAALEGEVEEYLGGQALSGDEDETSEAPEPARSYIESIEVEGFRGIGPAATLALTPGPGLTLVVGRNGSGKSSFAEALEFLLTGDNQRWSAGRAKIWKEGWRNLHQSERAQIRASLLLDGQPDAHSVTRTWAEGEGLDDGKTTSSAELGWEQPLATYRPFLSYNELGSMLDEGPSKLFDALASILGLEDLITAADTLKNARASRNKTHKAVKDKLKELRTNLEAHDDERAASCLTALKGTKWKLDDVETLSSMGATTEGSELETLRAIVNLQSPGAEATASAVSELRVAVSAAKEIERTDAAKALRRAELLDKALALHLHDGDGDCPICGSEAALSGEWHKEAEKEAQSLRAEAKAADKAARQRQAAEKSARALIASPPECVAKASSFELDGADTEHAWKIWSETSELEDLALAEAIEARAPALTEAIDSLREQAQQQLSEREDAWRPVARSLTEWIPGARRLMEEADTLKDLKSAEDFVRETATALRNERFLPIKTEVKEIWELLRTQSNVELEDVTFEGKTTSRRVNLEVTVDGTQGAALGVMSQGELHALALSLFLPRATLDQSPFRFLVIDDPVQSMDPARVDGLARVLERKAKERQVLVFTHDDRLPEAVRRLGIPAQVIEVLRREGSVVELRPVRSPVQQYLKDAFALLSDTKLPKVAKERVVPALCRHSLEAACVEVVRRRRLAQGDSHDDVETLLDTHSKLNSRLALALFDDETRGGDVMPYIHKNFGRVQADTVAECNRGAHQGFGGGDPVGFVRDVERIAQQILERK